MICHPLVVEATSMPSTLLIELKSIARHVSKCRLICLNRWISFCKNVHLLTFGVRHDSVWLRLKHDEGKQNLGRKCRIPAACSKPHHPCTDNATNAEEHCWYQPSFPAYR